MLYWDQRHLSNIYFYENNRLTLTRYIFDDFSCLSWFVFFDCCCFNWMLSAVLMGAESPQKKYPISPLILTCNATRKQRKLWNFAVFSKCQCCNFYKHY